MKLVSLDPKHHRAVIEIFSSEDLWRLSQVLEPGDTVTGRTERKIKVNEDTSVRKQLTLTLTVEKTELQGEILRISGITTENMDDIPKGSHHTITVQAHDTLTIEKDFMSWHLEKLQEQDHHPVLVVLMDREEAVFAVLRREPEIISTIRGNVPKKGIDGGNPYWSELAKETVALDERIRPQHIIVASPAFFKEYVIAELPEHVRKKAVGATISATGSAAMSELIRRPEVKQVLAQERYTQEHLYVDQVMEAIHKDLGAYGVKDVAEAVGNGNVLTLLVTTKLVHASREEGTYETIGELLKNAEKVGADVHVLETSAGRPIDKLGGIAGVRRW